MTEKVLAEQTISKNLYQLIESNTYGEITYDIYHIMKYENILLKSLENWSLEGSLCKFDEFCTEIKEEEENYDM